MLDPFSRGAIVGLSAFCVVGALALAPLRARSSLDDNLATPPRLTNSTSAEVVAAVPIVRDPFAEPVALDAAPAVATASRSTSNAPSETPPGGALAPLPNNLATDTIPALPGTAGDGAAQSRVTAVVTGSHPYAMIETAGMHEIKGLGDRVAGVPIVSIDITGVRLQTGAQLGVDHGASQ